LSDFGVAKVMVLIWDSNDSDRNGLEVTLRWTGMAQFMGHGLDKAGAGLKLWNNLLY